MAPIFVSIPIGDFALFLKEIDFITKNRRAHSTSDPLLVPFRVTSGSLPVHLGPINGHMRCPIIQFYKKMNFAKFADGRTDGRTEKKVTSKDPFC